MKKIRYISIFVVFLTFYLCVYAAQYYRVNNNTSQVINEHSKRYIVENKTGNDIFIPTNTSTEWDSFITNKPANVSLHTSWRKTSDWGGCSVSCGPGTKYRTASCLRSGGITVADSFCSGLDKPATSENCNNGDCGCSAGYGGIPSKSITNIAMNPPAYFYVYLPKGKNGETKMGGIELFTCGGSWGNSGCSSKTKSNWGPLYGYFLCKDGQWLYQSHTRDTCAATGMYCSTRSGSR